MSVSNVGASRLTSQWEKWQSSFHTLLRAMTVYWISVLPPKSYQFPMFLVFQHGWSIMYLQRVLSMPSSGGAGDTFSFLIFGILPMQVMIPSMFLAMLNLGPAHLLSLGFQK